MKSSWVGALRRRQSRAVGVTRTGYVSDVVVASAVAVGTNVREELERSSSGAGFGQWSEDGRLRVEAVAVSGRAVGVEFRLLGDLVSVGRVESVSVSLVDRLVLRRWIADALAGSPMYELAVDDVRLSVGWAGRVAVSLDAGGLGQAAVQEWELSPVEVHALLEAV